MFLKALESSTRLVFAFGLALAGATAILLTPEAAAAPATSVLHNPGGHPFPKPVSFSFDLTPSAGAAVCLPDAKGEVSITSRGQNQELELFVAGLPANTTFTVFILQLPHAPFGLSWYQGEVKTNRHGDGRASFVGIFNEGTFIVAPGAGAAPIVHPTDAAVNPQTAPVHTFHLGIWFNSTNDALAAGCAGNRTPFNGDHTAGIQVFNTTNFPDADGPLAQFGR